MDRKKNGGAMLVELVMVMVLLSVFGVTVYSFVVAGADTQARITERKDAQADARVALSYINVRLRQNDVSGKVAVEPLALTGGDALVIRDRSPEGSYDTWIYALNGRMYEFLGGAGDEPSEELSLHIVDVDRLETVMEADGSIRTTVHYLYGGRQVSMSATVMPRSDAASGDMLDGGLVLLP